MSLVNEKQPFTLRCAVLYCFQCFLHRNPDCQADVVRTLLPQTAQGEAPCRRRGSKPGVLRTLGQGQPSSRRPFNSLLTKLNLFHDGRPNRRFFFFPLGAGHSALPRQKVGPSPDSEGGPLCR